MVKELLNILKKDKTLGFIPHKDSVKRFKAKLKSVTNRSNGKSSTWVKFKLRQIGQGWIQYFKLADMKSLLKSFLYTINKEDLLDIKKYL